MISSEPLLKTQQVARALGVSGATVKRWVDNGLIRAIRTAGKHRLVPVSEVRRMGRQLAGPLGSGGLGNQPELPTIDDNERVVELLTRLLRGGNAAEARNLLRSVSRAGKGAAELADQVVCPVMGRIGHGWMVGSLDVYQEHFATSTVVAAIQERIDEVAAAQKKAEPLAIGCATEGDFYVLPGLLAELSLREAGWDVRNLGSNLPLRSLANAAREYRPRLIFLSINHLKDELRFTREYVAFYEAAAEVGAAVIVGGRALRPELRTQLPYAAFGDRMSHLVEFARRLTPRMSTHVTESIDATSIDPETTRSSEHHE